MFSMPLEGVPRQQAEQAGRIGSGLLLPEGALI